MDGVGWTGVFGVFEQKGAEFAEDEVGLFERRVVEDGPVCLSF